MLRSLLPLAVAALVLAAGAGGARPLLGQPFDVLPLANGTLVVTDMSAGAVYLIDPARRTGRKLAAVPSARELAALPDGRILVTSNEKVLAVPRRGGRPRLYARAAAPILGLARGADGSLYASEEGKTVVRIRAGRREELATGLDGVHGITVAPQGLVLGEAYAGRVLLLDLATREVKVLASELGNPGFTVPARSGGWYVSEFAAGRISRLHPDGRVTKVAEVPSVGPIAFDGHRRLVGVALDGRVWRLDGRRVRTIYP